MRLVDKLLIGVPAVVSGVLVVVTKLIASLIPRPRRKRSRRRCSPTTSCAARDGR
jgi:hypothetical protein